MTLENTLNITITITSRLRSLYQHKNNYTLNQKSPKIPLPPQNIHPLQKSLPYLEEKTKTILIPRKKSS